MSIVPLSFLNPHWLSGRSPDCSRCSFSRLSRTLARTFPAIDNKEMNSNNVEYTAVGAITVLNFNCTEYTNMVSVLSCILEPYRIHSYVGSIQSCLFDPVPILMGSILRCFRTAPNTWFNTELSIRTLLGPIPSVFSNFNEYKAID